MKKRLASICVALLVTLASSLHAQSLAEVAKKTADARAKAAADAAPPATKDSTITTTPPAPPPSKAYTNKDLGYVPPPPPPLTAAELADLDRAKFAKTYAAGKAVAEAQYLSVVGVSVRQLQDALVTFSTEISIASDHSTTKGEKALVTQYLLAQLSFQSALMSYRRYDASGYTAAMREASTRLDAANKIYLAK